MECQWCLELFCGDIHIPKQLPCHHTVCQRCLENLPQRLCPMPSCKRAFSCEPSMLQNHNQYLNFAAHRPGAEGDAELENTTRPDHQTDTMDIEDEQENADLGPSLESLPDVALLVVFRHLPVLDVLRLRRVSRRWRGLLLSPSVWRHRFLIAADHGDLEERGEEDPGRPAEWDTMSDRQAELVAAVLRVAPCVRKLTLSRRAVDMIGIGRLCAQTKCAVSRLKFDFVHDNLKSRTAALATFFLKNQVRLGRLRDLTVNITWWEDGLSDKDLRSAALLVEAAHGVRNLERLAVWHRDTLPPNIAARPIPEHIALPSDHKPSLKELRYQAGEPDEWVKLQLRLHAATLERVYLQDMKSPCPLVPTLLAACPHLRVLDCPLMLGLGPDHHFPGLEELALTLSTRADFGDVEEDDSVTRFREAVQGLAAMLSRASSHLSTLTLRGWSGFYAAGDEAVKQCLGAVASSGVASLRFLTICGRPNSTVVPTAMAAVTHLPNLNRLDLTFLAVDDGDLEAITPDNAPSLKLMTFAVKTSCLHCWVHRPEVVHFFERNRRVHATVVSRRNSLADEGDDCDECAGWACHGVLTQPNGTPRRCVYFYGHGDTEECSLGPEAHDQGIHPWVQVCV